MANSSAPPSYDLLESGLSNSSNIIASPTTNTSIERASIDDTPVVQSDERAEVPIQRSSRIDNDNLIPQTRETIQNTSANSTANTATDLNNATQQQHELNLPPDYYAPNRNANNNSRPESIASTVLPDYTRRNPAKPDALSPSRWGKYKTEEEYLAALRAFVYEKQFAQPGETTLVGFYGTKSVDEWVDSEARRKRHEKKEKKKKEKEAKKRNRAMSDTSSLAGPSTDAASVDDLSGQRRRSSVTAWLKNRVRKGSIAE